VAAVLGDCSNVFSSEQIQLGIKAFLKQGAIAHQEYLHYLDQKLKLIEISSPDWRTLFAKKFRQQFICCSIFFLDFPSNFQI
jgi:hypothetical protein